MIKLNPALKIKFWEKLKSLTFLDLSLYFCFKAVTFSTSDQLSEPSD